MAEVSGNSAKARELSEKLCKAVLSIGEGVNEVEQANQVLRGAIKEDGYAQTANLVSDIKKAMIEHKEPIMNVNKALLSYAEFLEEMAKRDS